MSHDSDPLPYSQVDRAVKPRAALLAGLMGVSNQHAVGSLVEFWDLCGDPRELERIVLETPVGAEPEVVLPLDEVARRFQLASGHKVEVGDLAALGFLELVDGGGRVRGMSRYFKVITSRLNARNKGRAGGIASAESRKAKQGTAQPKRRSRVGSGAASTSASGQLRRGFDAASTSAQAGVEPGPNPPEAADSGQRTAVKVPQEDSVGQGPTLSPPEEHPLQAIWNAHKGPQLPVWREVKGDRKARADARLKERPEAEHEAIVKRIAASAFCRGANDRGWRAGVDWFLKPGTAAKVLEGQYDDRQKGGPNLGAFDDVPEGGREVVWE